MLRPLLLQAILPQLEGESKPRSRNDAKRDSSWIKPLVEEFGDIVMESSIPEASSAEFDSVEKCRAITVQY